MSENRIKSYYEGQQDARQEILDWIKENSTFIEVEAGIGVTRDHFTSNDLIAFINSRR